MNLHQAIENLRQTLNRPCNNAIDRAATTRLLKLQAKRVVEAFDSLDEVHRARYGPNLSLVSENYPITRIRVVDLFDQDERTV